MTGERLVLVDDDEMIVRLYAHFLRAQGYEVETALDGASGLALIERVVPSLCLFDLDLPDFDGVELLRRVRSRLPEVAVLILSATREGPAIERARQAGATAILSKIGITPKGIVEAIRGALCREAPR